MNNVSIRINTPVRFLLNRGCRIFGLSFAVASAFAFSLFFAPPASAAPCSSVTQYGITWTFDTTYECGQFANGDYWVVGPVTITSITPDATGGRNGWEVNPQSHDLQPYDDRAYGYDASLMPTLPLTVQPTSSIVKAISAVVPEPHAYLQTAAVLTVVPSTPPDNGSSVFRTPYYGASSSKTTTCRPDSIYTRCSKTA